MANRYGLSDSALEQVTEAIRQFDQIVAVVLFGSRAKGNYKPGSDIDLAVKGDRVSPRIVAQLADCLNEETPLPYFFDVVHYETLDNQALVDHIDRVGIVIYSAGQTAPSA
ncbi:MAG: nucleotidyltransferase domain-containing protein [Nodosilinea sp.]|jgi:predicted nucleotidyltransferase